MKPSLCWLGMHEWNYWQETKRYYNNFGDWFKIHQERTCKCCGILQIRKIKSY